MYPIIFEGLVLGQFIVIPSYNFMVSLGLMTCITLNHINLRKILNPDHLLNYHIIFILSLILGSKVFFILEDFNTFMRNYNNDLFIFSNGFVVFGALIFIISSSVMFAKKLKIESIDVLNKITTGILFGQIIGRIGCFMAGCCYGLETDSMFGISYNAEYQSNIPVNIPLHPTQLYEVGWLILIYALVNFTKFKKEAFLWYLSFYCLGRFFIEFLRGDESRGLFLNNSISSSQIYSTLIICLILLYFGLFKKHFPQNIR